MSIKDIARIENTRAALMNIMLAAMMSVSICMNMQEADLLFLPMQERVVLLGLPKIVWNFYGSVNWIAAFIIGFVFFIFLCNKPSTDVNTFMRIILCLFSFFMAVVFLMAQGFCMNDSLEILISDISQISKSFIFFTGFFILFYELSETILFLLDAFNAEKRYNSFDFKKTFFTILFGWTPYFLISLPGSIVPDTYDELRSFFEKTEWNAGQSVFHLWYTGIVFKIGNMISGNFAIFLYCVIQTLIFAAILTHLFKLFAEMNVPRWLYVFTWVIIFWVPYFTNYISVVMKDTLYSYFCLLFVCEIIEISLNRGDYFRDIRCIFLWSVSVLGMLLFRINGKGLVYPTIVILIVYLYISRNSIALFVREVFFVVVPIIAANIIVVLLTNSYPVTPIRSELYIFNLPLQQTARYVKELEGEVTEEEKETIDAVWEYDKLANTYDPRVVDPVRGLYRQSASEKEWREYLKIWLSMGMKHPGVYIAATMNQSYYVFYTGVPNNIAIVGIDGGGGLYEMNSMQSVKEILEKTELEFHNISILAPLQKLLFILYQGLFFCPILGLISHPAAYTVLMILLLIYSLCRGYKHFIIAALPVVINTAGVILAPVIQRHPRYFFPVIYTLPALLGYYLYINRGMRVKENVQGGNSHE